MNKMEAIKLIRWVLWWFGLDCRLKNALKLYDKYMESLK